MNFLLTFLQDYILHLTPSPPHPTFSTAGNLTVQPSSLVSHKGCCVPVGTCCGVCPFLGSLGIKHCLCFSHLPKRVCLYVA